MSMTELTITNTLNKSSAIQPINATTFMVVPPDLGFTSPYPICVTLKDNHIILSEDELSEKELLEMVFEDTPSAGVGISVFKAEDLEDFIEEDPVLLAELYQLFDTHSRYSPEKLLDLVKYLNEKGFIPEVIIQKLLAASSEEVNKILSGNPWEEFIKLIS